MPRRADDDGACSSSRRFRLNPGKVANPSGCLEGLRSERGRFQGGDHFRENEGRDLLPRLLYQRLCELREIRVCCKYAVKAGAANAPGLLNVHGWMSQPGIVMEFVNDGWAEMARDYCGKSDDRPL